MNTAKATGLIYIARCLVTDKAYIGQTVSTLQTRKLKHLWCANRSQQYNWHFYNAIRAYGANAWEWSVLEDTIPREQLNERESFYIAQLGTFGEGGYNLTSGGGQQREVSESTRQKLSAVHKGRIKSPEWQAKITEALKGKIISEEQREKIRRSLKGKNAGERNPNYGQRGRKTSGFSGRSHSEETRAKMKEAHRGASTRSREVCCITTDTSYPSMTQASLETGVASSSILRCCKGELKTAGKLVWAWATQKDLSLLETRS
jgi:group I intron endonuclease